MYLNMVVIKRRRSGGYKLETQVSPWQHTTWQWRVSYFKFLVSSSVHTYLLLLLAAMMLRGSRHMSSMFATSQLILWMCLHLPICALALFHEWKTLSAKVKKFEDFLSNFDISIPVLMRYFKMGIKTGWWKRSSWLHVALQREVPFQFCLYLILLSLPYDNPAFVFSSWFKFIGEGLSDFLSSASFKVRMRALFQVPCYISSLFTHESLLWWAAILGWTDCSDTRSSTDVIHN